MGKPADAIVEYNRVLTSYFKHSVAASAQYRVARCLDALGRRADATGSYEAVVRGYPLEPEAPAAAYLAGVGMLAQKNAARRGARTSSSCSTATPRRSDAKGLVVFASPEHQEIVEAALCLLEYSYHQRRQPRPALRRSARHAPAACRRVTRRGVPTRC